MDPTGLVVYAMRSQNNTQVIQRYYFDQSNPVTLHTLPVKHVLARAESRSTPLTRQPSVATTVLPPPLISISAEYVPPHS